MNKRTRSQTRDILLPAGLFFLLLFLLNWGGFGSLLTFVIFGQSINLWFVILGFVSYVAALYTFDFETFGKTRLTSAPEPLFLLIGCVVGVIAYGAFKLDMTMMLANSVLAISGALLVYYMYSYSHLKYWPFW